MTQNPASPWDIARSPPVEQPDEEPMGAILTRPSLVQRYGESAGSSMNDGPAADHEGAAAEHAPPAA
eukprot:6250061-Heterocapsa_arctica.AAC.1